MFPVHRVGTPQSRALSPVLHVSPARTPPLQPLSAVRHVRPVSHPLLGHPPVYSVLPAIRLPIKQLFVQPAPPVAIRIPTVRRVSCVQAALGRVHCPAVVRYVLEVHLLQVVWDVCIVPRVCTRCPGLRHAVRVPCPPRRKQARLLVTYALLANYMLHCY